MCCWGLIARQDIPQPSTKPSLFGAVWNTVSLKSAGRCRLVIQLIQWRQATSVTNFFSHFLILLPTTSRGRRESFLIRNAETDNRTAAREVLFRGLVFVKVYRLLDSGIFFPPSLGLIVSGFDVVTVKIQISYHVLGISFPSNWR